MKKEDLFRAIGEAGDDLVCEADQPPAPAHRRLLRRMAPLCACLLLLIGIAAAWPYLHPSTQPAPPMDTKNADSGLSSAEQEAAPHSRGVTFAPFDPENQRGGTQETQKSTAEDKVASSASMDLVWLTPEELLAQDTLIFRGTVEAMETYTVDEIGPLGGYFTVAEVRITDVLRGTLTAGDTCRVFLPVVHGLMSNSIAGALDDIEVGSEAIFMPRPASPDTGVEESGRYFCYADVADAYFSEGLRFIFLQTEDGLRFERSAYEDIQDAQTLDEVAAYLRGMLE